MRVQSFQSFLTFLITLFIFLAVPFAYAKTINLYDQPKADAKVASTLDASNGMVPIFTPKEGDWIKVGDPVNGNVGWVKVSELGDESGAISTQMSVSQRTINTSKGPKTIQVMEFSIPKPMSVEQRTALAKQMQLHEQQLEQSIHSLMQSVERQANLQMMMPVIVFPEKATKQAIPKS